MNHAYMELIGIVAGILALSGYVPYVIAILRGTTKPNKASWIIWTLVGGILAFSYLAEGDQNAIWLPLGYFIGPLIVAILSLRYGYSDWSKFDTFCLTAALISIIPWMLSKDATMTLIINVLIDSAGALPTIIKTYREPETEDLTAWIIFFVANTLQLFAIRHWDITIIYPLYLFILASSIVMLIMRKKIKSKFNILCKSISQK